MDSTLAKSGAPAAGSANIIAAKENQVPNEILQTLETFKQFVKDQKIHSSDVSRGKYLKNNYKNFLYNIITNCYINI